MSRLERLINLTATLLATERPLTREELFERIPGYGGEPESQRRAFERDKDLLRELGIPVEVVTADPTSTDAADAYRIPRADYYLADPGLEADELGALNLALVSVRLPGTRGIEALWKLGGAPEPAPGALPFADLPDSGHLPALFTALSGRRTVTFTYKDGDVRTVDPWRLSAKGGHWYVVGYDHDRKERRSFRLDRIRGDVTVGDPAAFERPAEGVDIDTPPWLLGEGEPVVAELLVDADHAAWAADHLGPGSVLEHREDGAAVLAVPVTNRDAFRSFVLGFLDHAEVLGPPDLRAEIVEWLEALCPG